MKATQFTWQWHDGKQRIDPNMTREALAKSVRGWRSSRDLRVRRIGRSAFIVAIKSSVTTATVQPLQ